jgi:hypothetical protein
MPHACGSSRKFMTTNEINAKTIDEFLNSIEPHVSAYKPAVASYCGIRRGEEFVLAQGRVLLTAGALKTKLGHFETKNIRVGAFLLRDLGKEPGEFIKTLLLGKFPTPEGELAFPALENSEHSLYFQRFHSFGLQNQSRHRQLQISGNHRIHFHPTEIDWELKAASTPYHSLNELLQDYGVGGFEGHNLNVEINAMGVAFIDASSNISGTKAQLKMQLAGGLERNSSSIGYRILEKQIVTKRGLLQGKTLAWHEIDGVQYGNTELSVPVGAVLDCIANYKKEAQNFYFIVDPVTAPNLRRAAYVAFDKNLENLKELLNVKGKAQARDLESAIAWLLWMLGFSVTNPGGTKRTEDAADLIATTPQGHFGVLECTTGQLREDTKLPKLIERTQKVRISLQNSGHQVAKVIPIIVTNLSKAEVQADLEHARKLGVLVLTKDDFNDLVNKTLTLPDPDALFDQALAAIGRHQQTVSPLDEQFS